MATDTPQGELAEPVKFPSMGMLGRADVIRPVERQYLDQHARTGAIGAVRCLCVVGTELGLRADFTPGGRPCQGRRYGAGHAVQGDRRRPSAA
jgi:hypothetical protein